MLNINNENTNFKKTLSLQENLDNKKVKNCLPSFLFENNEKDDYFDDKNSIDSEEEKENETKKTSCETNNTTKNMFNKSFIMDNGKNIFDANINRNYTYSSQNLNVIRSNNSSMEANNNIYQVNISNSNSSCTTNNNILNDNFNNKNYCSNSFNQPIINPLYQNYISTHAINNNNFMSVSNINVNIPIFNNQINNQINNSKSFHYPPSLNYVTSFNNNNNNLLNYNINNNSFANSNNNSNKCCSFNLNSNNINIDLKNPMIVKKLSCDNEEQKVNNNIPDSNISIKKLINMSDYSLYSYIITQKGSRDMQSVLKKIKESDVDIFLEKLKNYFSEIIIHKYGNYFIRKLIHICLPSQRLKILILCKNKFVEISNSTHGTHPLQSLIELINMPEEKKLVQSYILNNELILSLDSKGTHIIQKFISGTKDDERKELNLNIMNIIDKLIIDPFGVCVIMKLVKHTKDKLIHKKIAEYIINHGSLTFIQHPYANYAVQILINSTDLSFCDNIIETIVDNYLSLSMQKFSSNVVENCIKYCDEKYVKKIFNSIVEDDKLESLLNNIYGNFVLEKLIARLSKEEKMVFIKKIEKIGKSKNLPSIIKNLLYG